MSSISEWAGKKTPLIMKDGTELVVDQIRWAQDLTDTERRVVDLLWSRFKLIEILPNGLTFETPEEFILGEEMEILKRIGSQGNHRLMDRTITMFRNGLR